LKSHLRELARVTVKGGRIYLAVDYKRLIPVKKVLLAGYYGAVLPEIKVEIDPPYELLGNILKEYFNFNNQLLPHREWIWDNAPFESAKLVTAFALEKKVG